MRVGEDGGVAVGRAVEEQELASRPGSACPESSTSWVAVRRIQVIGLVQRTISSTAVLSSPGSAAQRSRWSGCSESASTPWEIALRVVSLPATRSRMKKLAISWSVSRSPSTSALTSAVVRSSAGWLRRSTAIRVISPDNSSPAVRNAATACSSLSMSSGSPPDRITLDSCSTIVRSSSGTPMRSQMTRSGMGAARSATTSIVPSPSSAVRRARATTSSATACTEPTSPSRIRGVKALPRCGGSWRAGGRPC